MNGASSLKSSKEEKYKNDYFIIGDVELTMFEMAWHMVGMEKFMTDLATREPYIEALLDQYTDDALLISSFMKKPIIYKGRDQLREHLKRPLCRRRVRFRIGLTLEAARGWRSTRSPP